jgi:hypothetical protein
VIQGAGSVLEGRWRRSENAGVCPGDGMAGGLRSFYKCQTFTANRITRSPSGRYVWRLGGIQSCWLCALFFVRHPTRHLLITGILEQRFDPLMILP